MTAGSISSKGRITQHTFVNFPPSRALSCPPFVYSNFYSCPWPPQHRFPMDKFVNLMHHLRNENIYNQPFWTPSHPCDANSDIFNDIYDVHDKNYIDNFRQNLLTENQKRRIGLDFNEHLVHRTLAEVGGTAYTAELALQYGLAVNLAGGTHHAHRDFGSGFTIINDLAVASSRAMRCFDVSRVLIFDCDVHQGDGTATIFADDPNVFTVSIHCEENFPFKKSSSDLDCSLPAGTGDDDYLLAVKDTFFKAIQISTPQLILYDAGVDIATSDKLGLLHVSDTGIYARDRFVLSESLARGIPVAAVIGGGYDPDSRVLAARHALLHRAAIDAWAESRTN